jgi:hypothetical protein
LLEFHSVELDCGYLFWYVKPCFLGDVTGLLKEDTAATFRVEE